jgi:hypothetical protein
MSLHLSISSGHQMKKYRTPGKVPKSNRKIVERDKVVTLSTHIHDLSCSGTRTSLESGGVYYPFVCGKFNNNICVSYAFSFYFIDMNSQ